MQPYHIHKSQLQKQNETIAIFMEWANNYSHINQNWNDLMRIWDKLRTLLLTNHEKAELLEPDVITIMENICKADIKQTHTSLYEAILKYQNK